LTWPLVLFRLAHPKESTHLRVLTVKKSTSTKNKDTASTTTLATTACAALAGRSKGALQRDALSRSLAAALEQEALESVHSVTAHEPSGQVIVTLSNDAVVTSVPPSDDTGDAMSLSPVNPIQEWLQTTKEPPYKLTVTTVEAHESSLQPEVHKLYFQYQQAVHGDANPLLNDDMDSEENEEDWGEASEEYIASCKRMLAQEYGNHDESDAVENMNAAFSGFYRFLVETPIQYDGTYGTVHQHYRIDGKLIAIGVVDLLPHGLSSVYAIYDPAQHVTAFGKYLSLREIQYTSPQYYYLGYYIESCPKMRYKAEYQPSELLCPTTEKWVDAQQAQETLLQDSPERHCCTLYKSNDEKEMNGNKRPNARVSREVLNQVRLDVGTSSLVTLNMLHSGGQAVVRPLVEEFVKEMGPDMAREFIIKLV
jgi:arginine-tRNA-protein transferase